MTLALAGWLWADLLLGAFVIFAVANTAGAVPLPVPKSLPANATLGGRPAPIAGASVPVARADEPATARQPGVDPVPLELVLPIDGPALLGANLAAIVGEQRRIADEVAARVDPRRVALILAYGTHADLATGERLASIATAGLRLDGAVVKTFHNQVAGDVGRSLLLTIYFYQ